MTTGLRMPLIKAVAHVCIKTTDLEKTTAFYCGTLGMEKLFDFTRQGNVIGFYIKASHDTFIEVFQDDKNHTAHHATKPASFLFAHREHRTGQAGIAERWICTR